MNDIKDRNNTLVEKRTASDKMLVPNKLGLEGTRRQKLMGHEAALV